MAFQSIAREFGARAVAILLSGLLDDGVEGLREVTREGGITGVQQPEDAEAPDLPLNGILHDHPSYVMPVADLAAVFCELARHPYSSDQASVTARAATRAFQEKRILAQAMNAGSSAIKASVHDY